MDFGPPLIAKTPISLAVEKKELYVQSYKRKKMLNNLKMNLQMMYDDFMWRYGEERIQFAKDRLSVHEKNIRGECNFNPYTEPESDWQKYI